MNIIIYILNRLRILFKSLGKNEHKINNYIQYLFWKKRKDIFEFNYDDQIIIDPVDDEKVNALLPKKLAICITFYFREERIDTLKKVCKEFNTFAHDIDVTILTNENNEKKISSLKQSIGEVLKNFNIHMVEHLQHPQFLPWSHFNIMRKKIIDDSFTHFMYLEDDILINKQNIIYWLNARKTLKDFKLIPSFVRTEVNFKTNEVYVVDSTKKNNYKKMPKVISKTKDIAFVNLLFPYQPVYFYDKELMNEYFNGAASDPDFAIISARDQYQGIKERLNFMLTYYNIPKGFIHRYVVPVDIQKKSIKDYCLIKHLSNKYVNEDSPLSMIKLKDLFFN